MLLVGTPLSTVGPAWRRFQPPTYLKILGPLAIFCAKEAAEAAEAAAGCSGYKFPVSRGERAQAAGVLEAVLWTCPLRRARRNAAK